MKKILALIAFVVVSAIAPMASQAATQADGQINFFTFKTGTTSQGRVFGTDFVAPNSGTLLGSTFYAQIFGSTVNSEGSFVAIGSPITLSSGVANAGTITFTGALPGQTVFYQIRAWDVASGTTFANAQVIGKSSVQTAVLGGTLVSDGSVFSVPQANNFASFGVAAVPEPTTVALAVMGGLGLLARRRRNQA
jgi:hypothetical protein